MTELTGKVGFASPVSDKIFAKRRRAGVELFATLALAISLVIAATAVSIGARAQVLHAFPPPLAREVWDGGYSPLMPAALTIGHHLSMSAFW
jgi:hypothetical protein